VRRWASIAFLVLVGALLVKLAAGVDWRAAWTALRGLPASTLLMAAALAACSHAIVASYDLVGRHVTGHGLPRRKVVQVGFVSYAVNLNLGALVGGVAFRYRLYSRQGLEVGVITRVLALSILTNWLGYLLLAGALLVLAPPALPTRWGVPGQLLPLLGAAMLALAAAYLLLCAASRRREWVLHGRVLKLPGARTALRQLALSTTNWMVMAGVIAVLLQGRIEYPVVLGTLLLAAVAGVVAHVPAGLGVIEAVFVAMLAARLPQHELLAVLLAYRGLYYLVPLALASGLFFFVDRRGPGRAADADDPATQR
jgi:glycosyltransferase 2 family protein